MMNSDHVRIRYMTLLYHLNMNLVDIHYTLWHLWTMRQRTYQLSMMYMIQLQVMVQHVPRSMRHMVMYDHQHHWLYQRRMINI